ncbi:MAG: PIN domain-containing protein [Thermomicrobiales bacterium]|nr:PIN domain-containing protein [Thermomicrobiales bacterium]
MVFIDTNVFVHFFTSDHPDKSARSQSFFYTLIDDGAEATTSEAILAEVVWVLRSKAYRVPRAEIAEGVIALLELPGINMPHADLYVAAFRRFGNSRLDIADCFAIEHVLRSGTEVIMTFDDDFDGIEGIVRVEP